MWKNQLGQRVARKLNAEEISQNSPGMGTRSGPQGPCPGQRDSLDTEIRGEEKAKEQMKNKTRRPEKNWQRRRGRDNKRGEKMNN